MNHSLYVCTVKVPNQSTERFSRQHLCNGGRQDLHRRRVVGRWGPTVQKIIKQLGHRRTVYFKVTRKVKVEGTTIHTQWKADISGVNLKEEGLSSESRHRDTTRERGWVTQRTVTRETAQTLTPSTKSSDGNTICFFVNNRNSGFPRRSKNDTVTEILSPPLFRRGPGKGGTVASGSEPLNSPFQCVIKGTRQNLDGRM